MKKPVHLLMPSVEINKFLLKIAESKSIKWPDSTAHCSESSKSAWKKNRL